MREVRKALILFLTVSVLAISIPVLGFCADKTHIVLSGLGIAAADESAPSYKKFGAGFSFEVGQQITDKTIAVSSFYASELYGETGISSVNFKSVVGGVKYFFKEIENTKLNFYMMGATGWEALKDNGGTDNGLSLLFGAGSLYRLSQDFNLNVDLKVNTLGDDKTVIIGSVGVGATLF